tara:strand:+ start:92 stop:322 length:231 start_codon:yes stop_codon:yes gene_type:complete
MFDQDTWNNRVRIASEKFWEGMKNLSRPMREETLRDMASANRALRDLREEHYEKCKPGYLKMKATLKAMKGNNVQM